MKASGNIWAFLELRENVVVKRKNASLHRTAIHGFSNAFDASRQTLCKWHKLVNTKKGRPKPALTEIVHSGGKLRHIVFPFFLTIIIQISLRFKLNVIEIVQIVLVKIIKPPTS